MRRVRALECRPGVNKYRTQTWGKVKFIKLGLRRSSHPDTAPNVANCRKLACVTSISTEYKMEGGIARRSKPTLYINKSHYIPSKEHINIPEKR